MSYRELTPKHVVWYLVISSWIVEVERDGMSEDSEFLAFAKYFAFEYFETFVMITTLCCQFLFCHGRQCGMYYNTGIEGTRGKNDC